MRKYAYFFNSNLQLILVQPINQRVNSDGDLYDDLEAEDLLSMLNTIKGSYYGILDENLKHDQVGWVNNQVTKIGPSIEKLKADKTEAINFERERRGILPITFQGIEWDADELSQRNISAWMASIAAGVAIPTGFVWRATDNVNHPADAAFVNGLGAAITLRGTLLYQTSWGKKAAVNALTTVDAVKAYDVTAGW